MRCTGRTECRCRCCSYHEGYEAGQATHRPARGSDVEKYLRKWRDHLRGTGDEHDAWFVVDQILDDYRWRADVAAALGDALEDIGPA